ncbi:MAG: thioredoxin-disulfide reductase [Lachnospiraceae bacterium]|jgi:thioredoxin reductase (NADPH)|nr:thioredoxin-disulfide reductase [Lachnospiraceae bacterium]
MKDLIIIGAGPAGLTAAVYALRAGRSVLLLEAKNYGGQIVNTPEIENYPGLKSVSGFDFAQALYEQATGFGAELVYEKACGIEDRNGIKAVLTESGHEYEGRAVIIATGAKNRPLGLPREEELIGRGISYCATCDGMFFRKKDVAVCGGGNTALEDAFFLSNYCNKVYVIHRRDEFRGSAKDLEKLKTRPNVEFVLNANVTDLIGDAKLTAVEVTDKLTGEKREIPVSGLFVAIGQIPDNLAFTGVAKLDGSGYIEAGEDCRTGTPGVYTAGDCRTKEVRQLTTAAADGAVAALAASSGLE